MFMGQKPALDVRKEKKGFFRGGKLKQKTEDTGAVKVVVWEGNNHLWLMLHGGGWEWIVRDANGMTLVSGREAAPSHVMGETREAMFKAAARDLAHEKDIAKDLRNIVLLIEDSSVVSLDGKNALVHQQGERTLREVGGQLLGVKKAAFGQQILGHDSDTATVYTFADAEQLSRRLGSLDVLAPVVTARILLGNVLLHHAATHAGGGGAGCTILFSNTHCHVAVADPAHGVTAVRSIPVGMTTLVDAVAAANGLPAHEARDLLVTRDLLSSWSIEQDGGEDFSLSVSERALMTPLLRLVGNLRKTFSHFVEQRMGGRRGRFACVASPWRDPGVCGFFASGHES